MRQEYGYEAFIKEDLKTLNIVDYGLLTTGTLLTVIPVYFVYILIQRRMQEALVASYAKG